MFLAKNKVALEDMDTKTRKPKNKKTGVMC